MVCSSLQVPMSAAECFGRCEGTWHPKPVILGVNRVWGVLNTTVRITGKHFTAGGLMRCRLGPDGVTSYSAT